LSRRVKRWRALTEDTLSELGLSLGEFGVLVSLSESGPQLMTNLAKGQGITQAAITGIIDKLEGLGLAKREPSKTDKRKVRASITRRGEEQVSEGIRLYKKFVDKATKGVSIRDMNFILRLLDGMLEAAAT
jgi:DNA-binding MarR family transcriptional regulator